MKRIIRRQIAEFIVKKFSEESMLLEDYLSYHIDEIAAIGNVGFSSEEIFELLCDNSTKEYSEVLDELRLVIKRHRKAARINVEDDLIGHKLVLTKIGAKSNHAILESMHLAFAKIGVKNKTSRGSIYEEFCCKFLIDLGISSVVTPQSNDKGIDIYGKYDTKLNRICSKLIFNDNVYVLAQAKFLKSPVDVPVLRKLVGDSIFLRFDQLEYLDIGHNAIHLIVFSHNGFTEPAVTFSIKKKVMMITTDEMLNIISSNINYVDWLSYKYLMKFV
jgi:HJR/Mrr/RecB family endonuclease